MKKLIVGLLLIPVVLSCMENKAGESPEMSASASLPYQAKDADWTLMKAIDNSNYNEVLNALGEKANQNYLWPKDNEEAKRYADLTPAMFALKRLRAKNRSNYAWGLASAVTRDLGRIAISYITDHYAQQYPIISYVAPLQESNTAGFLFGSQFETQPVVEQYRPEKRIALALLIKDDTNVAIAREKKSEGNPLTVMTYLKSMLESYNPMTRKDGRDLSSQLSQVQRKKTGIEGGDDDIAILEERVRQANILGFTRDPLHPASRNRLYYLNGFE